MNTDLKVDQVRQLMKKGQIDAVIIPSDDPHKSEYVCDHWQARKWLTHFSGSAGTAVVTLDHALLWTDFRYYIQAESQIRGSVFKLFKTGAAGVPSLRRWLVENLAPGSVIGVDGALFSMGDIKRYASLFDEYDLKLDTGFDVIAPLWTDRPPVPASRAYGFSQKYSGEDRLSKLSRIREAMKKQRAAYHLMVSLDDIAWTLDLRGNDIHANPVNICFLLVGPDHCDLFIDPGKVDPDLRHALETDRVRILGYDRVMDALGQIPDKETVLLDPQATSTRLARAVNPGCRIMEKQSPAVALKAIKNKVQISHIQKTMVKDGAAVVNFLFWLSNQPAGPDLTEMSAAEKMFELRKAQPDFVDNSFDPIMAYGANSAMCHYSATPETDTPIEDSGMFLTDSGGNYLTGTTDITRTICRSFPSRQAVEDYTRVLKGHINVATQIFPQGTRGVQIDTLARQQLWRKGQDFGHGTGHGVGFFLCVHEGPARISPHPVDEALKPGMVLTNEPGLYRDGEYGIRLENMLLVREAFETTFGKFLKFENLTLCHFERELIDPKMLSHDELAWLNAYHEQVCHSLAGHLDKETATWLQDKTRKIAS